MHRWIVPTLLLAAAPPAWSDSIELANGDTLTGAVLERTDEFVVMLHPALGRLEIPVDELAPPEPPPPGLFGTGFLAGFQKRFELGANGEMGNTETTDVRVGLFLDYEDETRRWDFDSAYNFSNADDETTKNNAFAALERDWLRPGSRWFTFLTSRFDYDAFRSWEYRLNAGGGVGYDLYTRGRFDLRGRFGASVTKEWQGNADLLYELLVGLEAEYDIDENHSLRVRNRFYPALNERRYRNITDANWSWQIADDPNLSLELGFNNEYDSDPDGGLRNDFRYYTAIGLGF